MTSYTVLLRSTTMVYLQFIGVSDKSKTVEDSNKRVCPECEHVFKGNGFDGIDAHWRAKHEHVMPYEEAWPLIKPGTYGRE